MSCCLIKWVARLLVLVALGAWCLVGSWFRAFVPNGIAMNVATLHYSSLLDSYSLNIDISIILPVRTEASSSLREGSTAFEFRLLSA